MEEQDYINQIEDLNAEQIAEGIFEGKVKFVKLRETLRFDASKQKNVKAILKKKDDDAFASAHTVAELEQYLSHLQNYLTDLTGGNHQSAAETKIRQLQNQENAEEKKQNDRETMLENIRKDINEYGPDEIVTKLNAEDLRALCTELKLDPAIITNYTTPDLKHNDIPQIESDVPVGYTDVFFWGIPSSGKTCALAAILSTIKKNYTMEDPDTEKKFGATYRTGLVNIFREDIGSLPGRTIEDRTQYMPFLFYKRKEKNKRKISFFELSGEVFKYFFEIVNNSQLEEDKYDRKAVEKSFKTLELLLNSSNQKIHFFFIDYNQETKHTEDKNGLTQSNYLEAAATYFRDRNNIFRNKTDAVYIVVTKSDEIKDNKIKSDEIKDSKTKSDDNKDRNREKIARAFLEDNFGSFMDVLRYQCDTNSVAFKPILFSIGEVYFKRICKIDRSYSEEIIQDLLKRVKPSRDNKIRKFFNS